jgi:N6-adenosine-specific RNA methylase IME4
MSLVSDFSTYLNTKNVNPNKLTMGTVKTFIRKTLDQLDAYNLDILGFGMGRLFRQTHEICLIGTNNNKIYKHLKNKSQRSVSLDVNLKHSAKPEILQNALEAMFPACNRLEMFARRHRASWVCVGNEVCNGEDITKSIDNLLGT